ncbi:MAG: hypothetical protein OK449_02275 [Thaumarchaeota archaeon]|nr:hypothetical protein [Nitrososphaerota archaeon]
MASSSGIVAIIAALVTLLILSYGAYWAIEIRRALAVRLYRSQALGIGLLTISVGLAQLYYTGSIFYGWPPELSFASILFFSLALLYWTNTSVGAARKSDPRLRDTLGWTRLRLLLPALIAAAVIYDSANIIYNILNGHAVTATATGFLAITFEIPVLVPIVAAALILPVAALRSRDSVLRKHLLWFGLFAVFLLVFIEVLSSGLTDPLQIILVQDLGLVLGGYCIYKSAKSLVPLNKLASSSD